MARREQRAEPERRRRPILVVLFSLFPLLIGVGVLAPGMVTVLAEQDHVEAEHVRITRRLSRFGHQPLLLPRDFSVGFVPELLDLEHLFSRVDYMRDEKALKRALLPSFPRHFGDVIVLDDLDQRIREIVFKDPILVAQTAPAKWPPPAADLTPLGGPGPSGPGPRYDDYFGPQIDPEEPVVIPEPSTGLLFCLGLVGMSLSRRRYRQPMGS